MNQSFYIKISRMAKNNGYEITEIPDGVRISAPDAKEYRWMIHLLSRMKNIYFESYHYTNSARVYDRNDYEHHRESENRRKLIIDHFWEELHRNGGDPAAAQKSQRAYAESIGGLEEYNKIYA